MSWFDAKQLTSFAKSALTEAQKTLDKALDIQEEDAAGTAAGGERRKKTRKAPPDPLAQPVSATSSSSLRNQDDVSSSSTASSVASTASSAVASAMASSKLWGSFTGSFFDAGQVKSDRGSDVEEEMALGKTKTTLLETPSSSSDTVISCQPSLTSSLHPPPSSSSSSRRRSSSITSSTHSASAVMEEIEITTEEAALQPSSSDLMTYSEEQQQNHFEESKIVLNLEEDGFRPTELVIPDVTESSSKGSEMSEVDDHNSSMDSSSHTVMEPSMSSILGEFTESSSSTKLTLSCDQIEEGEEDLSLTHMLDEAICDHEKRSETDSSKSYEVVRGGASGADRSFPNSSGHTSGDEFETTTTSSDIEVIASPTMMMQRTVSPNGNGRKGQRSGHSSNGSDFGRPGLLHKIGHTRTSSEISAAGSEENGQGEMDRLLKKISELSEVLEARETKMVELSRANLELQEKNTDLNSQVKEAMKINAKLSEASVSSDDLTNRLSGMEKKLQKTLAEKDALATENAKLLKESSARISQNDLQSLVQEKDEIIEDLRHEGESLSKQVGKHADVIKKLRTKEKSNEKELKSLKTELEEKRTECDRLKKSLGAKDEVESRQIEAIQNLTTANSKWEEEHNRVRSDLEDAQEKVASLKTNLESAYKEIAELKRGLMEKEGEAQELALSKEMSAKQALQEQLRELQEQTRREKDHLYLQIDELRGALSAEERATARREEQLRRERDDLMSRLQQSENRHEELSGSVSAATRPLLRQIESLQANLNEAQAASERVERSLAERLQQATIQLAAAQERERTAAEQYMQVSGKTASLESKLNTLVRDKSSMEVRLDSETLKRQQLEEALAKTGSKGEAMRRSFAEEVEELKREKEFLEASFESEKADLGAERRKNLALADQLKDRDKRIKEIQTELDLMRSHLGSTRSSPTPSLSQLSMNGSITTGTEHGYSINPWPRTLRRHMSSSVVSDDIFDMSNRSLVSSNLYESLRQSGSTAALVENLQAQLKQRDGELVQLQMELGQTERAKDNLTLEVTRLSHKVEVIDGMHEEIDNLRKAYKEMEQKYQTMLTMYGEKVEEAEELRLDLADVKEMYKTQIEELVRSGK